MSWHPCKRATLLIPTNASIGKHHLFVLLTDQFQYESREVNIVTSISSLRERSDRTCLLYPGDHEFIRQNSFVAYYTSVVRETRQLLAGIDSRKFVPKQPMDPEIMARILKGALESRQTPDFIRQLLQNT